VIRGDVALLSGYPKLAHQHYEAAIQLGKRYGRNDTTAKARKLALTLSEAARPEPLTSARKLADDLRAERRAGNEWPTHTLDEVVLRVSLGEPDLAFEALDEGVALGLRDADWLLLDPLLASLRQEPGLTLCVEQIRELVEQQRQRVLADPSVAHLLAPPTAVKDAKM
ncbi:MAG: hypothetical protein MPN21_01730, partial [Thermoanaerobaculia bacterium]|nr:hypothetical protein [Thermoanaerobaculia bacterium]